MIRRHLGHYITLGIVSLLIVALFGFLSKGDPLVILTIVITSILLFWGGTFILTPQLERIRKKKEIMQQLLISRPGDPEAIEELYKNSLTYCQDLIEHYNESRYRMRIYYILSQLMIALLTGLTPILVILGHSELVVGEWFTWVKIIIPSLASIVASTATVFHLQEEWVQSKTTAESLEATMQEYLIGVPDQFDIQGNTEKKKLLQRKKALENLIVTFNRIHLNQVDHWASLQRSANNSNDSMIQYGADNNETNFSQNDVKVEQAPVTLDKRLDFDIHETNSDRLSSSQLQDENQVNEPQPISFKDNLQ